MKTSATVDRRVCHVAEGKSRLADSGVAFIQDNKTPTAGHHRAPLLTLSIREGEDWEVAT